jgi:hypothetical protein
MGLSPRFPDRKPSFGRRSWYVLRFAWSRHWSLIAFVAIAVAVGLFLLYFFHEIPRPQTYWEGLEPLIAIATVIIAYGVWWAEMAEAWSDSLERRICVHFLLDGMEIMYADRMPLASSGDARNWAQQIGSQMAHNLDNQSCNLALKVDIRSEAMGPRVDHADGTTYYLHDFTYNLRECPKSLKERRDLLKLPSGLSSDSLCLLWSRDLKPVYSPIWCTRDQDGRCALPLEPQPCDPSLNRSEPANGSGTRSAPPDKPSAPAQVVMDCRVSVSSESVSRTSLATTAVWLIVGVAIGFATAHVKRSARGEP